MKVPLDALREAIQAYLSEADLNPPPPFRTNERALRYAQESLEEWFKRNAKCPAHETPWGTTCTCKRSA